MENVNGESQEPGQQHRHTYGKLPSSETMAEIKLWLLKPRDNSKIVIYNGRRLEASHIPTSCKPHRQIKFMQRNSTQRQRGQTATIHKNMHEPS